MIEPEILERLQSLAARTGLSQSEQIRQGIRWWLESREWPIRKTHEASAGSSVSIEAPARRSVRRRAVRRSR